jgi:hypothetical protein
MSVSRVLQRLVRRIEPCLPRSAKQPPAWPEWIMGSSTTASAFSPSAMPVASPLTHAAAIKVARIAVGEVEDDISTPESDGKGSIKDG